MPQSQSKLRLMLLSVGSLSALNVMQALGARRGQCVVIGTNSIADAAGNFCCDAVHLVPPAAAGAEYVARLEALIHQEKPDLVIPTRDDDILALAAVGERACTRAILLTGTVASAHVMNDKLETARFASRHGLPFAETVANAREAIDLAAALGLPLIGKPRCGNGSRGVLLLRSMEEIERAFASRGDLVAQPFLDPPPDVRALTAPFRAGLPLFFSFPATLYSAEVMVGPDGASSTPFGSLNTQVGGMGTQMTRLADPALLAVGRAYARAAAAEGWKGPINLQLKRTREGDLVAFEMNGRFGGATAGRTLMGFDEIGEAVHRFLPGADFASISPPETDTVQRYPRTFPIPCQGRIALAEHGHWAARAVQPRLRAVDCASSTTIRMLLLSAGSFAARGIIDAIGPRRHRCLLLGTSSVANAAGNFSCDRVFVSPPAMQSSHYVECIAELIRQENPDIVIPTCDHDVVALATLAARAQAGRAVLLTGTLAAAHIMGDKIKAAHFANRHGLSFAQTVARADEACELARTVGFPLIGKPRVCHQNPGVVILRSVDEIERAFALRPDLVAQPYLGAPQEPDALVARFASGLPFFFSVHTQSVAMTIIIGPDGSVSPPGRTLGLAVSEQGTRLVRSNDREMRKLGRAFAHAAAKEGWRGPLNVKMMPGRDGRLTAYALDGCLGGVTAARAAMGVDDIADVVRLYVPAARFPSFDAETTDMVSIHPHSYPVLRNGVAALQGTGRWSKA